MLRGLRSRTFDDELSLAGTGLGTQGAAKAFLHLALSTPSSLATYDAVRGDSSLWDDLGSSGIVETRHERMVIAFLDALESLGRSPMSHLIIPRVLAGLVMIPVLTIFANAIGVLAGCWSAH